MCQEMLLIGSITSLVLFGAISTIVVASTDVSSFQFQSMSYVGEKLTNHTNPTQLNITYPSITKNTLQHSYTGTNNLKAYDNKIHDKHTNDSITIISSPIYSWIFKYVFNYNNTFSSYTEQRDIQTDKVILIVDRYFRDFLLQNAIDKSLEKDDLTGPYTKVFEIFTKSNKEIYFKGTAINYN